PPHRIRGDPPFPSAPARLAPVTATRKVNLPAEGSTPQPIASSPWQAPGGHPVHSARSWAGETSGGGSYYRRPPRERRTVGMGPIDRDRADDAVRRLLRSRSQSPSTEPESSLHLVDLLHPHRSV